MQFYWEKLLAKHGLRVQAYAEHKSRRQGSGEISCIASLRILLKRDPQGAVLDETLQLIKETWPDDPPLTKLFLEAIFDLLLEQTFQLKWPLFVSKLQGYRVDQIRQEASQLRLATTPPPTMRKAMKSKIIQLYNVGQTKDRRLRDDVIDIREELVV